MKTYNMKNLIKRFRLLVSIVQFSLITLSNCKKDGVILPLIVQFNLIAQNVTEGGEAIVTLLFDKAADRDGSVLVVAGGDANYGERYTTDPAINNRSFAVDIVKGQASAQFKVMTVDNTVFEGNKFISFNLTNPTDGLKLGTQTSIKVIIIDNEGPSLANFYVNGGIIKENDVNGIVVQIPLSAPAKGTGSMTITLNSTSAMYGKDFITIPATDGNSIALNVLPNETSANFTVLPIHNFIATQDLQIAFTISATSGVIQKGLSTKYSLTIINEDVASVVNFASSSGTLSENSADGIVVEIPFSTQAPGEGSITVSLTSASTSYGDQFTTVPAAAGNNTITLNISNAQQSASFKVLPVNNAYCNVERYIQFTISFVNGSVMKGSDLDYRLTLTDDEHASIVSFAENSGSIGENNAAGVVVHLNLSSPMIENGWFYVSPSDYGNSNKYITNPVMEYDYSGGSYMMINLPKDASSADFTVIPVNNADKTGNYVVDFSISYPYSNQGCIQVGQNSKYTLTIVDDD